MSKSKQKTTSSQTTNQTATTTPNTPDWLQQPWQAYTGKVTDLMNSGAPLVTGASDLQKQAFSAASNMGAGNQNFDLASMLAQKVGAAGPNTTGPAVQAGSYGYNPTTATSQGYTASGPVQVNGYTPAQTSAQGYTATNATAQGYNPALMDLMGVNVGQTTVGPTSQASSRNITDLNLNQYLNAGLGDQITAARADYDATGGQVRAQQSALAALNGGRRNSGNDIRAALTEGELSRAANTGLANIRANAYDQAGNLATSDLNREASTSAFNAGQNNQASLAQAQIDAARASQLAGLQFQGAQGNQNALNQAGQFNSAAQNDVNLANAGAANAASQFGANAQNSANLANTGFKNDALSQLLGLQTQAGMDYAGRQDAAGQFGASAANNASQFNANAANQAGQFGAAAVNQAAMFNADATNANNRFNAGQMDAGLARQLSAAGLLSDIGTGQGANERGNIALLADLGGQQRDIANQSGEAARLAAIQALLSGVPLQAFVGQTSNGTSQSNGTQTQTSSPSLLSSIQSGANTAASLAALFSDRRLKADIEPAGTDERGRRWYDYRYLWDAIGTRRRGVMAQEVAKTDPQAVLRHESGFLMVDYGKLGVA